MKSAKKVLKAIGKKKVSENQYKKYFVALALSLFVGTLGLDRLYLGYLPTAIFKLLTLGGLGIWSLIDFLLIALGTLKAKGNELPLQGYTKSTRFMKPAGIVIFCLVVLLYIGLGLFAGLTIHRNQQVIADNQTYTRAVTAAETLKSYISDTGKLPQTLEEAVPNKNLTNIFYRRDSAEVFTFCVTYNRGGVAGDGTPDQLPPAAYLNDRHLFVSKTHEAGRTCRTITPLLTVPDGTGSGAQTSKATDQACGAAGIVPGAYTDGTITQLTRLGESMAFTFKLPATEGGATYYVPPQAEIFDSACLSYDRQAVQNGDRVRIFERAPSPYTVGPPVEAADAFVLVVLNIRLPE